MNDDLPEDLLEDLSEEIREDVRKLLRLFPNSEYKGAIYTYDTGHSGSPVLAVRYNSKSREYGLDSTFIIKIGKEAWAYKQEELYNDLSKKSLPFFLAPFHMRSFSAVNGKMAVAYEVAFDNVTTPQLLMNILRELDEQRLSEDTIREQIEKLVNNLIDWYLEPSIAKPEGVQSPYTLLYQHLLTREQIERLLIKLDEHLPGWSFDQPQLLVDEFGRLLPNPLAYLEQKIWKEKVPFNSAFPRSRIHGDLHSKNILCFLQSEQGPRVIDLDLSRGDGVPFFDLAYLEFDMMRQILGVESESKRRKWLTFLNFSMTEIIPSHEAPPGGIATAWKFIKPLRSGVVRLQRTARGTDAYDLAWWLSTVAVGLHFARKGDQRHPYLERMAGLLYAAYGLAHILKQFNKGGHSNGFPLLVPWIEGMPPVSFSDENLPPNLRQKQKPLGSNQETSDDSKNNTAVFPLIAEDDENQQTSSSELEAVIQRRLKQAIKAFRSKGKIHRHMRNSTVEALQHLQKLLQERDLKIDIHDTSTKSHLETMIELWQDLVAHFSVFQERYPLLGNEYLSQLNYQEECTSICEQLEELLKHFVELLKELP